jgi:hypothetical protein
MILAGGSNRADDPIPDAENGFSGAIAAIWEPRWGLQRRRWESSRKDFRAGLNTPVGKNGLISMPD